MRKVFKVKNSWICTMFNLFGKGYTGPVAAPVRREVVSSIEGALVGGWKHMEERENYLILPAANHGGREYPEVFVTMDRIGRWVPGFDEKTAELGGFEDTGEQGNGRKYVGRIGHELALDLSAALGFSVLDVRRAVDFFRLIRSGKAYDGNGSRVDESVLEAIGEEIGLFGKRGPWRAEWLNDRYVMKEGRMYVVNKELVNGILEERNLLLDEYLADDSEVDVDDWLDRATAQGLPRADCKEGDLQYWRPVADRVAGFGAGSDGAVLFCGRRSSDTDSSLGVRGARENFDF